MSFSRITRMNEQRDKDQHLAARKGSSDGEANPRQVRDPIFNDSCVT